MEEIAALSDSVQKKMRLCSSGYYTPSCFRSPGNKATLSKKPCKPSRFIKFRVCAVSHVMSGKQLGTPVGNHFKGCGATLKMLR